MGRTTYIDPITRIPEEEREEGAPPTREADDIDRALAALDGVTVPPPPDLTEQDRAVGVRPQSSIAPGPHPAPRHATGGTVMASPPLSERARGVEGRLAGGGSATVRSDVERDAAGRPPEDARAAALEALARRTREPGAAALGSPAGPARTDAPRAVTRDMRPRLASPGAGPGFERRPDVQKPEDEERGPIHGIPTDEQVRAAEAGDMGRRILHGLGSAFRAYAGLGPTAFRSDADALRERQREGMSRYRAKDAEVDQTIGQKREERRAEESAARQAADAEAARGLAERRLEIAEGSAAERARTEAARRGLIGEQMESSRAERERETASAEEQRSPGSTASRAAQARFREQVAIYRAAGLTGLADELERIVPAERLEQMSAAELETVMRSLPNPGFRGRAGHSGGGGTSARRQALIDAYVEQGGDPRVAAAMADRALATATEQRSRSGGEGGEEVLPGVTARLLERGEARTLRQRMAAARSQLGALSEIDDITQRYGASSVMSPEARAEVLGPLTRLRAMVAQLQNTGVINPSEAPAIEAMLPDPRSLEQMTLGTLQARLRSFRAEVERAAMAELEARGIDDAGRTAALDYLRGRGGARGRGEGSAGGERDSRAAGAVPMHHPDDGRRVWVPRDQVEAARQAGFAPWEGR